MSRQISAIVCNASSSLGFFDSRSFRGLRGNVRLAGTAFDAADDFVGRDVRFDAIVRGRLARGRSSFLARIQYNSKSSDASSTSNGSSERAFRDGR
jgi:hypothetical protein